MPTFNWNENSTVQNQVYHHPLSLLAHERKYLGPRRALEHSNMVVRVRRHHPWYSRYGAFITVDSIRIDIPPKPLT